MSDTLNGLEIAVKLRNHVDDNPLAALLWCRLIYSEDPDAEAERIAAELEPLVTTALSALKAMGPAIRAYFDAAGPN